MDIESPHVALRTKRRQIGISARALSAELGKSPTYISKVESGDIQLSLSGFAELAKRLDLSHAEIVWIVKSACS